MIMTYVVNAQRFSAVSSYGDTLYYTIISDSTVELSPQCSLDTTIGAPPYDNFAWNSYMHDSLIIPENVVYNGVTYTVTSIGFGALTPVCDGIYYGDSIHCITLPNTVKVLRMASVSGMHHLTSLNLPESLLQIDGYALWENLELSVDVPASIPIIEDNAFHGTYNVNYYGSLNPAAWGCTKWNECNISSGLWISNDTLYKTNKMFSQFNLPNGLIFIEHDAFNGNHNIISINIPSTVTYIGDDAFSNCTNLTSIILPDGIEAISNRLFYNCTNLQGIVVRNRQLSSVGIMPFAFCESLVSISLSCQTPPVYDSSAFLFLPDSVSLFVPCGTTNAYIEVGLWNNYFNITQVCVNGTVVAQSNDLMMGTVTGGGSYNGGDTAVMVATAGIGHHFIGWSNGEISDTLRIIVNGDSTLTAYFAADTFMVAVAANDTVMGAVAGGGPYLYGDSATLTATATQHHFFVRRGDNSTDNPRTVSVTQDTLFTAYFAATIVDTVIEHDTTYIDVHDTTYIDVHDTTYIDVHDTTYIDVFVHDTTYIDVHDTTYIDVHDTTYVDVFVHDTTYINVPYPVHDTTYVNVPYPVHDTTYINVPYPVHDTTYLNVPYPVHDTTYVNVPVHDTTIVTDTLWLTLYDTVWLHDTVIIHDTIYITQEGIDGAEALNVKVYASNGQIVVEGAEGNDVTLYDVNGRMMAVKRDEHAPLRFDAPASGTYMIKIGNWPARKVVVIR